MNNSTEELRSVLKKIGPKTKPFGRNSPNKEVKDYEKIDFSKQTFSPTSSGEIPQDAVVFEKVSDIDTNNLDGKYLWVIDKSGSLQILLESTPNPKNDIRGHICHTNITSGDKAYQGGELWFVENGEVYINFKSGRYGAFNDKHRNGVIEYFRYKGYNVKMHPKFIV